MSDNKNFDNYIKGLFEEDSKVPAELQWDAMDFDLPKPNPTTPPRKSGRRYLFLLLLLLVFISGIAIYFTINKSQTHSLQATATPDDQKHSNDTDLLNDTETKIRIEKEARIESQKVTILQDNSTNTLNTETSNTQKPELSLTKSNTSTSNKKGPISKKAKNSIAKETQPSKKVPSDTQIADNNIQHKFTTAATTISSTTTNNPIKKPSFQSINLLPNIPFKNLAIFYDNKLNLILNPLPIDKKEKGKKFEISEILLGYGYHNFELKTDDSNILNNKINKVFGTSYSLGIRSNFNKKWSSNALLKYDQYHSTFDHTQDLDPIIDIQGLRRINRAEVTFHNNFTKTLGLQLGIDRRFHISDHLYLYTGLSFTPVYTISSTGKTIKNDNVAFLDAEDQTKKFSLSGGLNAGVAFPIGKNISLEMNYQFNRFLLNEIFINNGMNTNQQSVLSFMLSYKLQK